MNEFRLGTNLYFVCICSGIGLATYSVATLDGKLLDEPVLRFITLFIPLNIPVCIEFDQ